MGATERRQKEKQIRRRQILDAARQLLFSHGIDHISISRISRTAELGVGTIYFHYKNKEDIFVALQEEGLAILYDQVKAVADKPLAPDEKLYQIAMEFYDFAQTKPRYYDIINYFLSSSRFFFTADRKQQIDMAGFRILRRIRKIVAQGTDRHLFFEKEPDKFAVMFWGTLNGLLQFKKLEHTALEHTPHRDIYQYSVKKLLQTIVWNEPKFGEDE
ncbi:MAG TPA: TetR/AcrR family transcriptional regulator [Desulfotignum sp.]|nr:TetR/AcrR family transcriptional regulator [Desulfotignum sp.]